MAGEKPILLQAYRYVDLRRGIDPFEIWFLIKHTSNGPKISKIFKGLPTDHPLSYFLQSSCALIGSSLYVLGGDEMTEYYAPDGVTNHVRCLDIKKPTYGWKTCKPLARPCDSATVGVAGNLIYLLPRLRSSREGICYDTSELRSWIIEPPLPCRDCADPIYTPSDLPFCAAFDLDDGTDTPCRDCADPIYTPWDLPFCAAFDLDDGTDTRGVLAPLSDGGHVYIYNPDQNSWKNCCNSKLPNPPHDDCPAEHAFLNGLLYLSYFDLDFPDAATRLYVHDICNDRLLVDMQLPKFENLDRSIDYEISVVAVDDYKLCYLWSRNEVTFDKLTLYLAKVEIFPDCNTAIHSEFKVDLDACGLINCLPLPTGLVGSDSYQDQNEEICMQSLDQNGEISMRSLVRRKSRRRRSKSSCRRKLKKLQEEVQELKELIPSPNRMNSS